MKKIIHTTRLIDCTGAPVKENWSLIVEDGLIIKRWVLHQLRQSRGGGLGRSRRLGNTWFH